MIETTPKIAKARRASIFAEENQEEFIIQLDRSANIYLDNDNKRICLSVKNVKLDCPMFSDEFLRTLGDGLMLSNNAIDEIYEATMQAVKRQQAIQLLIGLIEE